MMKLDIEVLGDSVRVSSSHSVDPDLKEQSSEAAPRLQVHNVRSMCRVLLYSGVQEGVSLFSELRPK